jgi:transposase-like protein
LLGRMESCREIHRGGTRRSCGSGRCGWGDISDQHDSEWATISEVARLLGVGTAETVREWVRQAQVDAGARAGTTTEESAELKRLRRENAELRRANAILKTASAFFAAELDRPHH